MPKHAALAIVIGMVLCVLAPTFDLDEAEETRLVLLNPVHDGIPEFPNTIVAFGVTVGKKLVVNPRYEFDASKAPRSLTALSDPSLSVGYVATAGERFAYVLTRDGKDSRLERFEPFGERKATVAIPLENLTPAAMKEVHSTLYIGANGKVLAWDVLKKGTHPELVFKTKEKWAAAKNVDAFALCGDLLVAVDNVISPKWAFVFRLTGNRAAYLYTAKLPSGINSQYFEAAGADGKLAILGRYSHRGGSGEFVNLLEITEKELKHRCKFREFYPRSRGADMKTVKFVAGNRSSFRGVEFDGARLLLGAGKRGLIILPHDTTIEPSSVDLGGNCTDLVKRGDRLFALVQTVGETTRLVVLTKKMGDWGVEYRHDLEVRATRFAD
jgi:hypothetical protein